MSTRRNANSQPLKILNHRLLEKKKNRNGGRLITSRKPTVEQ